MEKKSGVFWRLALIQGFVVTLRVEALLCKWLELTFLKDPRFGVEVLALVIEVEFDLRSGFWLALKDFGLKLTSLETHDLNY